MLEKQSNPPEVKELPVLAQYEALKVYSGSLEITAEKQAQKISEYEAERERLLEIIRELKQHRFGPKKERWESGEQYCLFNEAEIESKKPDSELEKEEVIQVQGYSRKRGKRKPLPKNLPREVVILDLPEADKITEDGVRLQLIGKEVSEKLFYQPAQMKVIEYHRLRYGLDGGDTGKIAAPIPSIIPKGIATPSLLAQIVTSKYVDGLPLYRQEKIFERLDIDLPRCTMGRWIVQVAQACQPIWNLLEERLMSSPYVSCDETWTQVLKEKGRKPESQSWMWVRATPSADRKIVLFTYDPHRSGEVAKKLFSEFKGTLQVDGYSSYNILEKQKGINRIGCNMHGRRKYHQAWKTGSKSGQTLAAQGLKFYQRLYQVEEKAREKNLTFSERYNLRNQESRPIWREFKEWADQEHTKVPPKSKLGEAFHYFLGEYIYLTGYLNDGSFEMDNGFVERAIKNFAIGRNNWMFSDTPDGAEASSLLYSLAVTAYLNEVNPYKAFETLFTELPKAKVIEDYERLTDFILSGILPSEK
ncbi:MAG: IS66 family transposase [Holophagaceae bacterium]